MEFASVGHHYAGVDFAHGEFATRPVLRQEDAHFQKHYPFRAQIPWLLLCLGHRVYFLVSPDGQHQRTSLRLHLYVLPFFAGQPFFTRVHVNRCWTFALEFTVLLHGTFVALQQGNDLWPMFAFGFGGLFIITQMHGLGLSRNVRAFFLLVYAALALYIYSGRGLTNIHQITWIPFIEFLSVLVMALLFGGGLWLASRIKGRQRVSPEG